MRFINSLRNSGLALAGQIITTTMGIVLRWFFIRSLGKEYLGVNSVMESILMMLSMTELGIGASVAFALYKPVNDGDEKRIGSLMAFYRKTYHMTGIFTAIAGPLLIPFMRFFTRGAANVKDLNVIYIIFLANTVLGYFFSYKRTLISAYQQNYINSVTDDLSAVLKYILQIIALAVYKSYTGYLIINAVCALCANIVISVICNRKYAFVKKYKKEKLAPEDGAELKKSIVSLMYRKIGAKLVTGTDNLMISYAKFALMGIYSNYSTVIGVVSGIAYNVIYSVTGSIGNLMLQRDNARKYSVFEEFTFAAFAFYFFISVGLSSCLERFLALWAGEDWVLSPLVTFAVILNFFLTGMRQPNIVVIEAAGLFNRMRLKAVGEVIVNFAVSYIFLIVFRMGIYGVLFGTTVSMAGVCIWWEIIAVHKYSLHAPVRKYAANYIGYLAVAAVGCFAGYFISAAIPLNGVSGLILSLAAAITVYAALMLIIYGRTRRFGSLLKRFHSIRRSGE